MPTIGLLHIRPCTSRRSKYSWQSWHPAIAESLVALVERCDVIALAQASMADAADRVELDVPGLSSPRLAVSALVV